MESDDALQRLKRAWLICPEDQRAEWHYKAALLRSGMPVPDPTVEITGRNRVFDHGVQITYRVTDDHAPGYQLYRVRLWLRLFPPRRGATPPPERVVVRIDDADLVFNGNTVYGASMNRDHRVEIDELMEAAQVHGLMVGWRNIRFTDLFFTAERSQSNQR